MLQYWGGIRGLRVEYNALLGSGVLARNHEKSDRDCTLHVGCCNSNRLLLMMREKRVRR